MRAGRQHTATGDLHRRDPRAVVYSSAWYKADRHHPREPEVARAAQAARVLTGPVPRFVMPPASGEKTAGALGFADATDAKGERGEPAAAADASTLLLHLDPGAIEDLP